MKNSNHLTVTFLIQSFADRIWITSTISFALKGLEEFTRGEKKINHAETQKKMVNGNNFFFFNLEENQGKIK